MALWKISISCQNLHTALWDGHQSILAGANFVIRAFAISKWSPVWNIQKETFPFWFHFNWKALQSFLSKTVQVINSFSFVLNSICEIGKHYLTSSELRFQIMSPTLSVISYSKSFGGCAMFPCKIFMWQAINFWSEFFPSTGWAVLLEKVKLWGARRKSRWLLSRKRHQTRIVPFQFFTYKLHIW